jgi:hypothetical protein
MLPPFIIEQIRKREEERQRREIHLELPLPMVPIPPRASVNDEETDRGVVIVDLG